MKRERRRIGFVYPFPHLEVTPSVRASVQYLSRKGYVVDIYAKTEDTYPLPSIKERNIFFFAPLPFSKRRHIAKLFPGRIASFQWLPMLAFFLHKLSPYLCFFVFDPEGLFYFQRFRRVVRVPFFYWSLELHFTESIKAKGRKFLKKIEASLISDAKQIIVQDSERGKALLEENGLKKAPLLYVPNSPLGRGRVRRTNFWHEKFSLPSEAKVILYAGSFFAWAHVDDLLKSVGEWPKGFVLVLHSKKEISQQVRDGLVRDNGRVYCSSDPLPVPDYEKAVAGTTIGIAFFFPYEHNVRGNRNLLHLGFSSGKIAYYFKNGIPVIMNSFPSISKRIGEAGAGFVVEQVSQVGKAIKIIEERYGEYQENTVKFYNRHLEFGSHFENVERALRRCHWQGQNEFLCS